MDTNGTIAPSNIVINGQEYSPEEAQEYIETGRHARELEQKWNVKLDSVWPEYGKTRENLRTLEQERDAARRELDEFKVKQQREIDTPQDIKAAREAAKKLGIILDEDTKGFVTEDKLENWYTSRREKERMEEDGVKAVLEEADSLAAEINKTDTPAKFNKKAVLAYASAYGISDLRQAYEDMNADVLGPWKEAQLASHKSKSLKTLSPGSKKEPDEVKVTNDNVRDLLHETLMGSTS